MMRTTSDPTSVIAQMMVRQETLDGQALESRAMAS